MIHKHYKAFQINTQTPQSSATFDLERKCSASYNRVLLEGSTGEPQPSSSRDVFDHDRWASAASPDQQQKPYRQGRVPVSTEIIS